jgi:hypothetical protein
MDYHDKLKLWAKRRKRAVAMVNSGKTRGQVAELLGITRQRLHQIIGKEISRNG